MIASQASADTVSDRKWDTFPIAAYDSNTGVGGGAKSFLLNPTGHRESIDLALYATTLGERWAKGVVSYPDQGLRHGTIFPWAVDVTAEYDRMIRNHFFGLGNTSRNADRETYDKEPLLLEGEVSRALSRRWVVRGGLRFRDTLNRCVKAGGLLEALGTPSVGRATYASGFLGVQFDSRDAYLRPNTGWLCEGEIEDAPGPFGDGKRFVRWEVGARRFIPTGFLGTVVAARVRCAGLDHRDLPIQALLSLGGGSTLRGYAQDRFLDAALSVANVEWRFPVVGRLGAVVGVDAGKVWQSFSRMDLGSWAWNTVVGARYYMDTFTVRGDWGLSREGSGLYLNFDQVI